jgi:G3E family GTPase
MNLPAGSKNVITPRCGGERISGVAQRGVQHDKRQHRARLLGDRPAWRVHERAKGRHDPIVGEYLEAAREQLDRLEGNERGIAGVGGQRRKRGQQQRHGIAERRHIAAQERHERHPFQRERTQIHVAAARQLGCGTGERQRELARGGRDPGRRVRQRGVLGRAEHKDIRRWPQREQQRRRRLTLVADLRQARSDTAEEDDALQRSMLDVVDQRGGIVSDRRFVSRGKQCLVVRVQSRQTR